MRKRVRSSDSDQRKPQPVCLLLDGLGEIHAALVPEINCSARMLLALQKGLGEGLCLGRAGEVERSLVGSHIHRGSDVEPYPARSRVGEFQGEAERISANTKHDGWRT